MLEIPPALSLPLVRPGVNQDWEGVPAVQVKPSPPMFVNTTSCEDGFMLTEVVYESVVVFKVIDGGATVIVIGMMEELPATLLPVSGSTALTVTLVLKVEPPTIPVTLAMILTAALLPPGTRDG